MSGTAPELKFHIVRAGAGAGKTRGLVEKVVEVFKLYQTAGLSPRLVVTTFTRKATQELKERLILKACVEHDSQLLQFVSDPTRLQISTIHGLLNMFLRQVGHLAGLDAGFQLIGGKEVNTMARLALRESVLAHPHGLRWIETYGFARVLSMCRRYETAKREQGRLAPATLEDLQQAANQEAANWKNELGELSLRILEEVDDPKWEEFAQNLQSFLIGWTGNCSELELLPSKPRRSKKQESVEDWHQRTEDTLKEFKKEMGKPCWNRDLWEKMIEGWKEFAPLAEEFSQRFTQQKDAQARFELADLELKAMEIVRAKPFLGAIFSESWDFWMIDEYQDTSPLQVACLKALIGEKPTYFVGDPQQSIYLFRGAEVRVFDQAEQEVIEKGGNKIELRRNYRSQPDLLHWINDFMSSVSSSFQAMESREEPSEPNRSCVHLLRADDDQKELNALVARVQKLTDEGISLEKICVLGRTHKTLMDVSRALRERGFPTHVHSSRGFSTRREVIDAQALWKFLVNPHDNLNLMILLRSPWFFTPDNLLREWMMDRPRSLWRKLEATSGLPESVRHLHKATQRLTEVGLSRTFEETLCSAAYLDLSLVNDPAGRKESNLWKLIHRARSLESEGGVSVLNFLDQEAEADPLDSSEGDATSAQEPNCINLMTIHGSKGLEFDHVFVPRMGESPRTSMTPPLDAEHGRFFFPLWDDESGEFVASPLDFLKARDQRQRELIEFDRWLYVALTRAKSTLTLSWSEIGRDSWAARSPMFAQEPGVYTKSCYTYEIIHADTTPTNYVPTAQAIPDVRQPWQSLTHDFEERKAVTDLIQSQVRGNGDYLKRWKAQNLGTRIHRALEALKFGGSIGEENEDAVNFVLSLQSPPMEQLIQVGEAEWGFQVQTPSRVVEGQIDLWAKLGDKIYVIDYKSGAPSGKEAAFEQMGLYAWALRKFGHQEPIELVVIYPLRESVETRSFDEQLFLTWENEFSRTKT